MKDLLHQLDITEVLAITRGVLTDQKEFTHAIIGKPCGFLQNLSRPT